MNKTTDIVKAGLAKRYARERRFRLFGLSAIVLSISFLAILLITIFAQGLPALRQTYVQLAVNIDPAILQASASDSPEVLQKNRNYTKVLEKALNERFPGVTERKQKLALLKGILSKSAESDLRKAVLANPSLIGTQQNFWFLANDDIDTYMKGNIDRTAPEADRRIKDYQLAWLDDLEAKGQIEKRINSVFFSSGDSREPEQAGVLGALMGSLYTMFVTLSISFPLAVAAAIYLEEFAPKNNPVVDFIEVNINNLAAVPSIVFGLLGLAVFIQFFGVPRSTPLVGGLVLSLQTLPIIIIAARAALKAVPPSIRQAAYGMGASRMQTVFHHTLPLAMPGILTGTILGMAHALGETAPLLMVGMVAFIMNVPQGITDPATILPVQIYLWSDSPERAFVEKTSAAIIVLLFFLILMNLIAVLFRKKFERRW